MGVPFEVMTMRDHVDVERDPRIFEDLTVWDMTRNLNELFRMFGVPYQVVLQETRPEACQVEGCSGAWVGQDGIGGPMLCHDHMVQVRDEMATAVRIRNDPKGRPGGNIGAYRMVCSNEVGVPRGDVETGDVILRPHYMGSQRPGRYNQRDEGGPHERFVYSCSSCGTRLETVSTNVEGQDTIGWWCENCQSFVVPPAGVGYKGDD